MIEVDLEEIIKSLEDKGCRIVRFGETEEDKYLIKENVKILKDEIDKEIIIKIKNNGKQY